MHWHWSDALSLFHHLPQHLALLERHEDKNLVQAALPVFILRPPATPPQTAATDTLSIEKLLDPEIARACENLGTLLRDYLHTLPEYDTNSPVGEALLAHWRKLLQEQAPRHAERDAATGKLQLARHFWQAHIKPPQHLPAPQELEKMLTDCERAAGMHLPPGISPGPLQSRQWQDLVIRQRLHQLDLANMARSR